MCATTRTLFHPTWPMVETEQESPFLGCIYGLEGPFGIQLAVPMALYLGMDSHHPFLFRK